MPDFGRRNDEPSLDAIINSDRFIDALAHGQQPPPQDQGDAMLAELLGGWRDEMRWPPATGLITERDAINALRTGLAEKQRGGRSRRGLSIVGAAAAGVLVFGGFGAVVYGAGPGDALYGLHTMLFGEPKQVREDAVTLASAQEQLAQVQQLVAQGDWPAAQAKLVEVNNSVATVSEDAPLKQEVLQQWNQLSAKVVQQNPEATVPPGITYTVPPSATELIPATITVTTGPEVPPTNACRSADCDSPITISTTPDGTGTFGPSPSDTPTSGTPASDTPTSSPVQQTEPTTTTPAPTTTTQVPTTTTSAAPTTTTTVAPTTTTTTVQPTTTTTTTTLAGATSTSPSAAAQSPAAATATSQPAAESPAAAATTSAPAAASTPTATLQQTQQQTVASIPSTVVQAPKTQPPAAVITTTMVMPMPQAPKQPSSGGGHSNGGSGN